MPTDGGDVAESCETHGRKWLDFGGKKLYNGFVPRKCISICIESICVCAGFKLLTFPRSLSSSPVPAGLDMYLLRGHFFLVPN